MNSKWFLSLSVVAAVLVFTGCKAEDNNDETSTGEKYDLSEYIYPATDIEKTYDAYTYNNDVLAMTSIGYDSESITVTGNTMIIDSFSSYSYDNTYVDVSSQALRYVEIGQTYRTDGSESCVLTNHMDTYSYPKADGYTYSDVIEVTCTDIDSTDGTVDKTKTYYAKGIGEVAEIDEDCNDENYDMHDDWDASQCVTTWSGHILLQVN